MMCNEFHFIQILSSFEKTDARRINKSETECHIERQLSEIKLFVNKQCHVNDQSVFVEK